MKTQELKDRINTKFIGFGHYKITIKFRGKFYTATTTNTMAIDKIGDDTITKKKYYTTEKQALLSLFNECKDKNNL